jgi:hypothetical protein
MRRLGREDGRDELDVAHVAQPRDSGPVGVERQPFEILEQRERPAAVVTRSSAVRICGTSTSAAVSGGAGSGQPSRAISRSIVRTWARDRGSHLAA